MVIIIGCLFLLGGILYINRSSSPSYNIRMVKGVQQPGETDQQYEQRLRKKLKSFGISTIFLGVVCIVSGIFLIK